MSDINEIGNDYDVDDIIDKGIENDEEEIYDVDIRACKFSTYGGDFIVRQLIDMIAEKEIDIPKIQRHYVWTTKIASRFIESILLDLPLPSIFLAKGEDGRFIVIDGLQRLTTLYKYIFEGVKDGKVFKLSTSKDIREEWRGKAFRELDIEDQRRIRNKLLHAIIVEQKEPANFNGLYLIFERINSGGLQLNQQEIRNAIFQYPINEAINQLNDFSDWRKLFGSSTPHTRMRDNEMILRFLALDNLNINTYSKESLNMVELLNDFLSNNKTASISAIELIKDKFIQTIEIVVQLFGFEIFRTNIQNLHVSQKFYATTYDAIMLAISYAKKRGIDFDKITDIEQKVKILFSDNDFKAACSVHTTDLSAIRKRINRASVILFGLNYEN
jgi:uncharacterized protein with ParB-like and HNH nuclease domain